MAKFGCPPRFIAMVRQFHDGMQTRVQNDGAFSEPFEVKQGCGMAPTLVSQSCDNYDLTISTKKEIVHQPAPGKPYNEPTITVNGENLEVVDKFTYLPGSTLSRAGSSLSRAVHIGDEVFARIAKASVAFGRLLDQLANLHSDTLRDLAPLPYGEV